MNFKKSMIFMVVAILILAVFVACGDKKHKNDHDHSHADESANDSLRKADSLRQVKEHGHAH